MAATSATSAFRMSDYIGHSILQQSGNVCVMRTTCISTGKSVVLKRVSLQKGKQRRFDKDAGVAAATADMQQNTPTDEYHITKGLYDTAAATNETAFVRPLELKRDYKSDVIVFEDYPGGDLGDLLMDIPDGQFLPNEIVLSYATQLLRAVDHMHAHACVHRDIKVENILLSKDGATVRLGDFGFALAFGKTHATEWPSMTTTCPIAEPILRTATCRFGTPVYISPEVIRLYDKLAAIETKTTEQNKEVPSSHHELLLLSGISQVELFAIYRAGDVWALGNVFYQMYTGNYLFFADDDSDSESDSESDSGSCSISDKCLRKLFQNIGAFTGLAEDHFEQQARHRPHARMSPDRRNVEFEHLIARMLCPLWRLRISANFALKTILRISASRTAAADTTVASVISVESTVLQQNKTAAPISVASSRRRSYSGE